MKKFRIANNRIRRCLRDAGGVFLGAQIHMPVSIWDGVCECNPDGNNHTWTRMAVSIGLFAWQWSFCIDWNIQPITDPTL